MVGRGVGLDERVENERKQWIINQSIREKLCLSVWMADERNRIRNSMRPINFCCFFFLLRVPLLPFHPIPLFLAFFFD